MADFEVNEKSSFDIEIELTDSNGNALSPIDKVEWWVGIPSSEDPIIDKVEISGPTPSFTLTIPPEAHICTGRGDEERFVILRVESGNYVKHKQYDYVVLNLGLVPYPEG